MDNFYGPLEDNSSSISIPNPFFNLDPKNGLLKSIDTWLELIYSFSIMKESARLGLIGEDVYKTGVEKLLNIATSVAQANTNNNSHNEKSE